ncbi:MAG: oxidoreductase [Candidatus Sericytochromatia bacterium]|nr:oxidoreductase [Candidatus Sericytochromatia bacterium]
MPIRVGLVGYGFAGKTFHAPVIAAVPGLRLAAVASRQWEQLSADLPDVAVVADPLALVTGADVDLVVIASPNETHLPLALAALRAGRHVVVDKPFTVTLAQARELAEAARAEGRILSVFQNRRWDSDFLGARQIVAAGRLGEIVHYESHFDRFRPDVRARWREQSGPGTGVWFDLGPHLVDQALCLFGLPKTVSARLARQRDGAQTDDWAHVVLDYGRLQVILHGSMLTAGNGPRFILHGTRGSWLKHGSDVQEDQLLAGMRPGDAGWGHDPVAGHCHDGATGAVTGAAEPPHQGLGLGPGPEDPLP